MTELNIREHQRQLALEMAIAHHRYHFSQKCEVASGDTSVLETAKQFYDFLRAKSNDL